MQPDAGVSTSRTAAVFAARRAGVLLHPTSLPGDGDSGTLGAEAFRFIDFLAECGFSVWQVLPLGPTHADRSPYQCLSAHAGNPALIDLQRLVEAGWLDAGAAGDRAARLIDAHAGFLRAGDTGAHAAMADFVAAHASWLNDFALYQAVRGEQGGLPWNEWPAPLRDREPAALAAAAARLAQPMQQQRFEQFMFFRQWSALHDYARQKQVLLFGDLPIFVAHDSADVWAQREYFQLDALGVARVVAGVPPDYFSATGQRWGNPHYDWERMLNDDFRWWETRLRNQLELFDLLRIDHFRGFEACWEIPGNAETAMQGRWVPAPGVELFTHLQQTFPDLPLVAEDLGIITPQVEALRLRFGLPGMKILQFAFDGGSDNPYLPHNHEPLSVVYTGTHDNDTTLGWFQSLSAARRLEVREYLGCGDESMPWPLVRTALASVARLAMVPMQDLLALDGQHRMNIPGVAEGNWRWRFEWAQLPADLSVHLRAWVHRFGRDPVLR